MDTLRIQVSRGGDMMRCETRRGGPSLADDKYVGARHMNWTIPVIVLLSTAPRLRCARYGVEIVIEGETLLDLLKQASEMCCDAWIGLQNAGDGWALQVNGQICQPETNSQQDVHDRHEQFAAEVNVDDSLIARYKPDVGRQRFNVQHALQMASLCVELQQEGSQLKV